MKAPITAEDFIPLVTRLSQHERLRLIQLLTDTPSDDAVSYANTPIRQGEFSVEEEPLAWDADGWEDFE